MLDIIESNISTLRDRLTARNSKSDVLQVFERRRKLRKDQVRVQSFVRDVRESHDRQLLARGGVCHDVEGARLRKAGRGAGVSSKAEPEAVEIERLDARACNCLRVGVQRQLAELQEVERPSGSCVLGLGVRDYARDAFDRALSSIVSKFVCLFGIMGTNKSNDTAPSQAVVQSDREQLRRSDVRSEVVKLGVSGQRMLA